MGFQPIYGLRSAIYHFALHNLNKWSDDPRFKPLSEKTRQLNQQPN